MSKSLGHAKARTPEYLAWRNMHARCNETSGRVFDSYGARGIKVCARWNDYPTFFADVGLRPSPTHSLDRIDNDRGYEPGNVRWATKKEQGQNRRTTKLEEHEPEQIRWLASLGYFHHDIAGFFGVARAHVTSIVLHRRR